jgi:tetratricopeptide (TPR) repeat protein
MAPGGEAVDMRGSMGAFYKPTYNFIIHNADEIPNLPSIPDPPSDFTGRDDELKDMLAKLASGTNIIGLRGIGGVGKTALALKLGESLKDRYPDGLVMVDMRGTSDNPLSSLEAMGAVIHAYYLNEKIPDNEAEINEMYRRVLNGKHAFLLLDNALDDKQVLKLIPPKSCGLLITSRKMIKLPGLFRKDLYVLKPDEALELLLKVWSSTSGSAEPPRADPAWSEIASLCGFLPLALRAAASLLANTPDLSPASYAEELKDECTRLERIGEEGVELSVDASFNLSFKRLDAKTQQTFLDASIFPTDFDSRAEEQICQDKGHKRLSELVRWSLLDYNPHGPDYGRYKLHDLARLFALARRYEEASSVIHERHSEYYIELLYSINTLYLKGGGSIQAGLALFDREWANIKAGWSWAESQISNGMNQEHAFRLCKDYANAGAHVLELRLHPAEKISWLEAGLKAARSLRDRLAEGVYLGNLGLANLDLGDARTAIKYYEQALTVSSDIGDKRNEGVWLGGLGLASTALGDARNAINYCEQALIVARGIGDKRNEGVHLGNQGVAYAALGDFNKAIDNYVQALAIAREIGDRRSEGAHLGNLGLAYADLGEARQAIDYYDQALVIAREIGDRRSEGAHLGNLGNAYSSLGDAKTAIDYYEKDLAITYKIGDRRGEGTALWNMSLALDKLGKRAQAIECAKASLKIREDIEDPRAAKVRRKLQEWGKIDADSIK